MGFFSSIFSGINKSVAEAYEKKTIELFEKARRKSSNELKEKIQLVDQQMLKTALLLALAGNDPYEAARIAKENNLVEFHFQKFMMSNHSELERCATELVKQLKQYN